MTTRTSKCYDNLKRGLPFTYKLSDGGDFASMRGIFKYGQEITISPIRDFHEVQVGDIVYVQWRGNNYILHPVQEINDDQFLIINSLGKVNGWVHGSAILGKVTRIIDPEIRPAVTDMLVMLQAAYQELAQKYANGANDVLRLEGIVQDLRWYMDRIGPSRWNKLPRQNRWSFESNLWYLTKQATAAAAIGTTTADGAIWPITYYIDQGKWVLGFVAEAVALFENYDWDYLP